MTVELHSSDNITRKIRVGGSIDRLDAVTDEETGHRCIRVIDYKTGAKDIVHTPKSINDIFNPSEFGSDKHPDYYLQSMLYSLIVRNNKEINPTSSPVSPSLLFIQRTFGDKYDPTIIIGKQKVKDIQEYAVEYESLLQSLIAEIYSPDTPFIPTDDPNRCRTCPYCSLCGKFQ